MRGAAVPINAPQDDSCQKLILLRIYQLHLYGLIRCATIESKCKIYDILISWLLLAITWTRKTYSVSNPHSEWGYNAFLMQ